MTRQQKCNVAVGGGNHPGATHIPLETSGHSHWPRLHDAVQCWTQGWRWGSRQTECRPNWTAASERKSEKVYSRFKSGATCAVTTVHMPPAYLAQAYLGKREGGKMVDRCRLSIQQHYCRHTLCLSGADPRQCGLHPWNLDEVHIPCSLLCTNC